MRLMAQIPEVVVVFDGHGCHMYSYGGGIPFAPLVEMIRDLAGELSAPELDVAR